MAKSREAKRWELEEIDFLRWGQNFSMGLSSGEYGGKNINRSSNLFAIWNNEFFRWKAALSMTITLSFVRHGKKQC